MFNTMFNKGALPFAEKWLHFTAARHRAIANNIANVETPFYRAMDAPEGPFKKIMLQALETQKRSPVGTFQLSRRNGIIPRKGGLDVDFIERPGNKGGLLRHIENNVDIDFEFAQMVKNSGTHNMLATIIAHQFSIMREAIAERVA